MAAKAALQVVMFISQSVSLCANSKKSPRRTQKDPVSKGRLIEQLSQPQGFQAGLYTHSLCLEFYKMEFKTQIPFLQYGSMI